MIAVLTASQLRSLAQRRPLLATLLWLVVLLHTAVNNTAGFWLPITAACTPRCSS